MPKFKRPRKFNPITGKPEITTRVIDWRGWGLLDEFDGGEQEELINMLNTSIEYLTNNYTIYNQVGNVQLELTQYVPPAIIRIYRGYRREFSIPILVNELQTQLPQITSQVLSENNPVNQIDPEAEALRIFCDRYTQYLNSYI